MEYMMKYDAKEAGGPLEDVLCRYFTADVEQFGEKQEMELKEGGKDIPVTEANRQEFLDLFIDFTFRK